MDGNGDRMSDQALPLDYELDPFDGAPVTETESGPCAKCGRREPDGHLWEPDRLCSDCFSGPDRYVRDAEREPRV